MRSIPLLDSYLAYEDAGHGRPVVLLHGNPTSSLIWRRVFPLLSGSARVLAPDLIGMGESGKPESDYRFADHADYLDAWFAALDLDDVLLVGHDWGGALALDWASRHPDSVRGVVLLETILRPTSWDAFAEPTREFFTKLRTPGVGEAMILDANLFIEQALPFGINRPLDPGEHDLYRKPFPTPASRRPILQWTRSLPIDGEPADVAERVAQYGDWLATSAGVPKLLITFDPAPGLLVGPAEVEWARQHVSALTVVSGGPAGHHAPEDAPDAIAAAILDWAGSTIAPRHAGAGQ